MYVEYSHYFELTLFLVMSMVFMLRPMTSQLIVISLLNVEYDVGWPAMLKVSGPAHHAGEAKVLSYITEN